MRSLIFPAPVRAASTAAPIASELSSPCGVSFRSANARAAQIFSDFFATRFAVGSCSSFFLSSRNDQKTYATNLTHQPQSQDQRQHLPMPTNFKSRKSLSTSYSFESIVL